MSTFSARSRLATLAIASAALAAAAMPASAQQVKYCQGGALVANSFYSNVNSNGKTADVVYYGQFQNMNPTNTIKAQLVKLTKIGLLTVKTQLGTPITLPPYQQQTVTLMTLLSPNPSGSGAPTPQEVGAKISFICTLS